MLYCSEVWGIFHSSKRAKRYNNDYGLEDYFLKHSLEIEHRKFIRFCLGVSKHSFNMALYGETGTYPLYVHIFKAAINFFYHVLESPVDSLLYQAFLHNTQQSNESDDTYNWSFQMRSLLKYYGFEHVWFNKDPTNKAGVVRAFINKVKDKFRNLWKKTFHDQKNSNKKMYRYIDYKGAFGIANYVQKIQNFHIRKAITRIRICDLKLEIETLRYVKPKPERDKRICRNCDANTCEDEEHFLLSCTKFNVLRQEILQDASNMGYDDLLQSESLTVLTRF